jgi:hypothetical protein
MAALLFRSQLRRAARRLGTVRRVLLNHLLEERCHLPVSTDLPLGLLGAGEGLTHLTPHLTLASRLALLRSTVMRPQGSADDRDCDRDRDRSIRAT